MRLIPRPHRLIRATCQAVTGCRRTITAWQAGRWPLRWVLLTGLALLAPLLTASGAHAEAVQVLALASSVNDVLNKVRTWIMGILAGLATVFLSIGGVRYVMAGGDPGEVEKAKTAFKSAGWGYALAALAPVVVQVLKGIVGAN